VTTSTQALRDPPPTRERGDRHDHQQGGRQRALKHQEKVDLALLAMPTLALALAITIVSTQLGEVTRHYASDDGDRSDHRR
jgi:hypothetical protein